MSIITNIDFILFYKKFFKQLHILSNVNVYKFNMFKIVHKL